MSSFLSLPTLRRILPNAIMDVAAADWGGGYNFGNIGPGHGPDEETHP